MDSSVAQPFYLRPRVVDYGTIVTMASDLGLLIPGISAGSSLSAPTAPGGSGGGNVPTLGGEGGSGAPTGGGGGTPEVGGVNVTGGDGSGGGGSGGGGPVVDGELAGGEERGELPFSGFPAALVAAVGGTLAATGAALRRAVRREDD